MPVSNENSVSDAYYPNGVAVDFAFEFKAASAGEVIAVDGAGNLISKALYNVTLDEDEGGTLTFHTAPTATDYPVLYVVSDPALTQPADFDNAGPSFNPANMTRALDRAATRDLKQQREIDRGIRVPFGEAGILIPSAAARLGKFLAFNGAGEAIAVAGAIAVAPIAENIVTESGSTVQAALDGSVGLKAAETYAGADWSGDGQRSVYVGDQAGAGVIDEGGADAGLNRAYGIVAIGGNVLSQGAFGYDYSVFVGYDSGRLATGGYCTTAIGLRTGMNLTAVSRYNVFVGCDAGLTLTDGMENVFVGAKAGLLGTTMSYCVAIGSSALYHSTTALDAIAIGALAGLENISGGRFVAIGTRALEKNTINSFSIAIGHFTLRLATASGNTVVGYQGAQGTTTGSGITAMGADVLAANDNGSNIVAIGSAASYWNVSGGSFVAIGRQAGYFNTAGSYVAIGDLAAYNTTSASAFVALGRGAAGATSTGTQFVVIGDGAYGANTAGNSAVVIGFQAAGNANASSLLAAGWRALFNVTSGAGNVGLGESTGSTGAVGAVAVTTGTYNLFAGYQASALSAATSFAVALGRDALAGSSGTAVGAYAAANDNAIALGRAASAATATGATTAHKSAQLAIGSAAYPVGVRGDGSVFPSSGASAGFMEIKLNGTAYKVELMAA